MRISGPYKELAEYRCPTVVEEWTVAARVWEIS